MLLEVSVDITRQRYLSFLRMQSLFASLHDLKQKTSLVIHDFAQHEMCSLFGSDEVNPH